MLLSANNKPLNSSEKPVRTGFFCFVASLAQGCKLMSCLGLFLSAFVTFFLVNIEILPNFASLSRFAKSKTGFAPKHHEY
jgi:hypothetical protein